jgi:hypothetical protein
MYELMNFDVNAFKAVPTVKKQRSTPSEDVVNEVIESCEVLEVTAEESEARTKLYEANGWPDAHGACVAGTQYFLINGYQRVYFTHNSNLKEDSDEFFKITETVSGTGANKKVSTKVEFLATHFSYSKSKGFFLFEIK